MTAGITVVCANPDEMRLRVTAEMSIRDWRHILGLTDANKMPFYAPFEEFRGAIRKAIATIDERAYVEFEAVP